MGVQGGEIMRKGKSVLVVVILFSLCFFLTGCFDMSMVIDIKDPEEQVSAKVTLTTPSEEAFDLIKSEAYKEDLIGPDKPDAVQSKTREGEGVYSLEVKKDGQLGNTNIEVNILDDQVTYTLENIIWEGENSSENEEDMDYSSWFEGYSYEFIVSLPDKVQTAWWTDLDHNKI